MPRLKPNRALVTLLFVSIVAGLLWSFVAKPGEFTVAFGQLMQTEAGIDQRFGVIMVYLVIGFIFSLAWGWWAEHHLRHYGLFIVLVYVMALSGAAFIAYRVGVAFGPPDPDTLSGLVEGDSVPDRLALDGPVPGLSWLIGGFFGLNLAMYVRYLREHKTYELPFTEDL